MKEFKQVLILLAFSSTVVSQVPPVSSLSKLQKFRAHGGFPRAKQTKFYRNIFPLENMGRSKVPGIAI